MGPDEHCLGRTVFAVGRSNSVVRVRERMSRCDGPGRPGCRERMLRCDGPGRPGCWSEKVRGGQLSCGSEEDWKNGERLAQSGLPETFTCTPRSRMETQDGPK